MGNTKPPSHSQLYECGICDCLHPWHFFGDCRDDSNRYADEEAFAARHAIDPMAVEVFSWEERLIADGLLIKGEPNNPTA
ncbi:MAG: hypothetical protein C4534_02065 [Gaiellales bacterium]|nr:MAG: hypothetical protein C4534_02065 [Gaiellales bacterium]